ncbi:MAG: hypothetical protein J7J29_09565 [Psychrobacter sp.]|nr:hypothetical protein [Psychrobacter sp.]
MTKDNRTNLKADHGQHSDSQPHKRGLLLRFTIFMAWVAGIGLLLSLVACQQVQPKQIATDDSSGYYIDLSKISSDMPSRTSLAFFVPDNSAASQAVSIRSSTAPQAHLSATRGQTIISKVTTSPTDYDGLTLQNKIAERRICRAVTTKTESKTRHPIPLPYSVALTHNLVGGYHA